MLTEGDSMIHSSYYSCCQLSCLGYELGSLIKKGEACKQSDINISASVLCLVVHVAEVSMTPHAPRLAP